MTDDDRIPVVETYRGVGIHDFQPRDRIQTVVKPAIDLVIGMTDPVALVGYAGNTAFPPEARLFAEARAEACWQLAAEGRAIRPTISLTSLRASTAGLDSRRWMSVTHYVSMLDHGQSGAVAREVPLTDEQCGRSI